jgi:hypothetical protein
MEIKVCRCSEKACLTKYHGRYVGEKTYGDPGNEGKWRR